MKVRSKLLLVAVATVVIVVSLAGVAFAAGPWAKSGAEGQDMRRLGDLAGLGRSSRGGRGTPCASRSR